ncbi:MAG: hypothetical protein ACLU9V_00265 [Roseburia sp.]
MGDLQNTSAEGTQTSTEGTQQSGKTFTQDDVNRIVQERLAKRKARHPVTRISKRKPQNWKRERQSLKQERTGSTL